MPDTCSSSLNAPRDWHQPSGTSCARSVSLLQLNTIITVETCCIIHGKVCCNGLMQRFLATRAHRCNNCCNTRALLQRQPLCFDHVITYVVMSYVFQRNIKKTYNWQTLLYTRGSSSSVKKKNRYAGGGRHHAKPRVIPDHRCTTWRHCNSLKHRDCNARACRSACNVSNTVQKETENTLGYKRSTLNLTTSPAMMPSHVLIILNIVLLIYIPGMAISLVVITDIQGLCAIDRNACVGILPFLCGRG